MGRLIFRRLIFCVFVLWGVTLITFLLSRVVPGDPARLIAGPRANAAAIAHVRSLYGLDQSLLQQYLHYMGDLLHGNLGVSFMTRRPVVQDLRRYFPATIELTLYALLIGVGFALIAALIAARRRGSAVDQSVELTAVFGVSLPAFWVALLLQLVVGVKLQWLPVSGRLDAGQAPPPHITGLYTVDGLLTGHVPVAVSAFQHLLLPALALAVGVYGLMARIVRASLLEVAGEDYVRTAEAKGLTRRGCSAGTCSGMRCSRPSPCSASSSPCWPAACSSSSTCSRSPASASTRSTRSPPRTTTRSWAPRCWLPSRTC